LLFLNILWRFIFVSKNRRQYRSHPVNIKRCNHEPQRKCVTRKPV
jgi:hypothetical protein